MAKAVVMPKLGLTMIEGTLIKWLKKEGDSVSVGDALAEIETEKITHTIEARISGILLKILAKESDIYPVAAAIAYIGAPGEELPDGITGGKVAFRPAGTQADIMPAAAAPPVPGSPRIKISPLARATADKLNVNYTRIIGTGPGGRIVKADILAASAAYDGEAPLPGVIPYSGMRKAVGTKLSVSWSQAPMVTHHVQADVTELLAFRETLNGNLLEGQFKLSVTDLIVKVTAKALKRHPILNSTLAGDEIRLLKDIHVGVAVALENGLVVPVIRETDKKSVFEIGRELRDLAGRARSRGLKDSEMRGSTFTITNLGSFASVDYFTPILNAPEAAILGLGRAVKMPAIVNDAVTIRSLMGLSLTFDHRIVDGAPAAEFLATLLKLLANPARALFE